MKPPTKEQATVATHPLALVVEDQLMNQKLVAAQLQQLNWRCEIVPTGLQALDALRQRHFDVVLMDWQLDGMDGLETTRQIRVRELQAGADPVPIIAITARAMAGDRQQCLDAGMNAFLTKPVSIEDLRLVLEKSQPDCRVVPNENSAPLERSEPLARLLEELGDTSVVAAIVTSFLEELPLRARSLIEAAQIRDDDAVQRAAHSLVSTSNALGALALATVVLEVKSALSSSTDVLGAVLRRFELAVTDTTLQFSVIRDELTAN